MANSIAKPCLAIAEGAADLTAARSMFERHPSGITKPSGVPLSRHDGVTMTNVVAPLAMTRADELQDCSDAELLKMIHSLPRGARSRDRACEVLVARYQPLVRAC